jgi:hypothetical protein
MNAISTSDAALLKTLTDPKTPFIDIVRAIYRTQRVLGEVARDLLVAELPNLQEAVGLSEPLNAANVGRSVTPKPSDLAEWDYQSCSIGATIWLPEPIKALFWLYIGFSDEGDRLSVGFDFPRRSNRDRWLASLAEPPEFVQPDWGYALERSTPLGDITHVEETLGNLLQDFLAEVHRVRRPSGET